MPELGNMSVSFSANTDGLMGGISSAKGALSSFAGAAGPVVGILAGVGIAAIGVGAASVKMAADFQTGLTTLVTGAGESQKNIAMVRQGIMDMAVSTGTSTAQLV